MYLELLWVVPNSDTFRNDSDKTLQENSTTWSIFFRITYLITHFFPFVFVDTSKMIIFSIVVPEPLENQK